MSSSLAAERLRQMEANGFVHCEICERRFSEEQQATLPELVSDDGRENRFCPACRCDLVEDWPSEDCEEAELQEVAEWRRQNPELCT